MKLKHDLNGPVTLRDHEQLMAAILSISEKMATKEDLEKLATKVDTLEIKVDNLELKVDNLELKVDNLELKVDKVSYDVSDIKRRVIDLETDRIGRQEFTVFKKQVLKQ